MPQPLDLLGFGENRLQTCTLLLISVFCHGKAGKFHPAELDTACHRYVTALFSAEKVRKNGQVPDFPKTLFFTRFSVLRPFVTGLTRQPAERAEGLPGLEILGLPSLSYIILCVQRIVLEGPGLLLLRTWAKFSAICPEIFERRAQVRGLAACPRAGCRPAPGMTPSWSNPWPNVQLLVKYTETTISFSFGNGSKPRFTPQRTFNNPHCANMGGFARAVALQDSFLAGSAILGSQLNRGFPKVFVNGKPQLFQPGKPIQRKNGTLFERPWYGCLNRISPNPAGHFHVHGARVASHHH